MDPNDLEWLKEEKNKRLEKKGMIELAIEQEILMEQLQPDQIEEEDQEGIKVTRKEVIPNKVYRLFYEFLRRTTGLTFDLTKRRTIIKFYIDKHDYDYDYDYDYDAFTMIIDDNLMHLTSKSIERVKVKNKLRIPEEDMIFKYGELNYYPLKRINELILEGSKSKVVFQYLPIPIPKDNLMVSINIGGKVIVDKGRIIGAIEIEYTN